MDDLARRTPPGSSGPGRFASQKDPEHVAVALIDAFEGAVTRAKVERNRSPFDTFEAFVLPALIT